MSISPSQTWEPNALNLRRPCVCYHGLCKLVCVLVLLGGRRFLCSRSLPPVLTPFPSPPMSHSSLSPEGRGIMKTSYLGLGTPKSLSLCSLPSCRSPCQFLPTARRSCSDDGWARHRSMDTAECHWESFYWYVPLTEHSIWFPLDP